MIFNFAVVDRKNKDLKFQILSQRGYDYTMPAALIL